MLRIELYILSPLLDQLTLILYGYVNQFCQHFMLRSGELFSFTIGHLVFGANPLSLNILAAISFLT
jgi:hypothetical protein